MLQFRKKPVVIEAVCHSLMDSDENGPFPVFDTKPPAWLLQAMEIPEGDAGEVFWDNEGLKIRTLEGVHLASPGDWIIQGVKGEIYPCKDEIFKMTYEAVDV